MSHLDLDLEPIETLSRELVAQIRPSGTAAVTAFTVPEKSGLVIRFATVVNHDNQDRDFMIYQDETGTPTYDEDTMIARGTVARDTESPQTNIFLASNTPGATFGVEVSNANSLTFNFWGTVYDLS